MKSIVFGEIILKKIKMKKRFGFIGTLMVAAVSIMGATGAVSAKPIKVSPEGDSYNIQLMTQGRVASCEGKFELTQYCTALAMIQRLEKKSHGRLKFTITTLSELGLAGPDILRLVGDGTLQMAEVYSGYIAGDVPFVDIVNMWGMYESLPQQLEVIDATRDEIAAELGKQNAVVLSNGYYPYNYVYTSKDIQTAADLEGLKIRSHSTVLSDMLSGVGAIGTFIAFSEVYGALERGVVEGAVASVDGAFAAHWYEVTGYMTGPVNALALTWLTINQDLFDSMDDGLQALMIAEGIHREKQVIIGVFRDTSKFAQALKDKGMVERPWPAGAVAKLKDASVSLVLPGWVERTGGADSYAVKVFNENLADILGVRVLADGSSEKF